MSWKNMFELDQNLAFGDGFKIDFYDALGNVANSVNVRYAGASNKNFTAFRNAFMKPYERKVAMGNMPPAESDKLLQECFIKGKIIASWSDETPLTVESFRAAMEEAAPEVWNDIMNTAYNAKFFAVVSREAETGN